MLRIRDAALKHGCTREDASYAYDMPLYEAELDDGTDPPKLLVIGPNLVGNLLELIGAEMEDGDIWIWHAMSCRKEYLDLLPHKEGVQ